MFVITTPAWAMLMIFGLTFVLSAFVLQSLDFSKIMKKDSRSTAQGTALLVLLTFLFAAILGFFFIFILNLPWGL